MRIHEISIGNPSNLDLQLQESVKEIYNKLRARTKVFITIWLRLYDVAKVETSDLKLLESEKETLEEEILQLRRKKDRAKKEEEFEKLLDKITRLRRELIQENFFEKHINSKSHIILDEDDKDAFIEKYIKEIKTKVGEICFQKSGLTIDEITKHTLNEIEYRPIRGSSYMDLPPSLKNRRSLINIKNTSDNECFRWCHLAHLYPADKNPQRITKYKDKIDTLNYDGIEFPVKTKDFKKIEELNRDNPIRFNVFRYEVGVNKIHPLYISKSKSSNTCRILLIEDNKNDISHYVYIKDFNMLLNTESKDGHRRHYCDYCLQGFTKDYILRNHIKVCLEINGTQSIRLPSYKNSTLKFTNQRRQIKTPFIIYADFESILEKTKESLGSSTEVINNHRPCGFAYKLLCNYDDSFSKDIVCYRGKDAISKFINSLLKEEEYCKEIMKKELNKFESIENMSITPEQEEEFNESIRCHICKGKYTEKDKKVKDHCHMTGEYRGAAHRSCNLNLQLTKRIPVVFHNLRGYDGHFIILELGKYSKELNKDIGIIPNNMEKYLTIIFRDLVFIDSLQFLLQSLDKLVKNLDDIPITIKEFEFDKESNLKKLLMKKGIYPYEYMDSFDRFNETHLPSKDYFYSSLKDEHITTEEYLHAQEMWKQFKCKTLGDYHDLYLKTDVLLLADVFETFRSTCLKYYNLDPAHNFSTPGFSWDAMLKMTDIKLDLITDIDMHLMIEKCIRGGISYISHRYAKANNKYLPDYDPTKPSSYIIYLDANNLYGWAMSQPLPTGNFRWLKPGEDLPEDLDSYLVECDLEYPKKLKNSNKFDDYPLAPEKVIVKDEWLSDYQKNLKAKHNIASDSIPKLLCTLKKKEKYIVHGRLLNLYLKLGMKITKVYRILKFDSSPWLKEYIDFNTNKRSKATNEFEKNHFKLMNNSVYGKTMENLRNRENINLYNNYDKFIKEASKPTFVNGRKFNENLYAVHAIKEELLLNKPCYVGGCILELSKYLMYDFHYNIIQKLYPNAKLLFTDTDSLCYYIETDDIYEELYNSDLRDIFDNSDYSKDSPYFFNHNKKVIGKMKDETAGKPISEFVGLKSKMYTYRVGDSVTKKCKGIVKNVVSKSLKLENYKEVLFNSSQMKNDMKNFRSKNHEIKTVNINKISLSSFDNKRYILDDGVTTLPYK